jgi:hypothetical protein
MLNALYTTPHWRQQVIAEQPRPQCMPFKRSRILSIDTALPPSTGHKPSTSVKTTSGPEKEIPALRNAPKFEGPTPRTTGHPLQVGHFLTRPVSAFPQYSLSGTRTPNRAKNTGNNTSFFSNHVPMSLKVVTSHDNLRIQSRRPAGDAQPLRH